ncbi:alpha/beta-hydrolase [Aspergillus heteromorphus CBS 117.55]|uniref:Alpha/beta-hydrolase n=1 Tax=Aspergillus heteromorphus CBS 117.55 TaxID=1448321 RepID=A0A317WWL7_9EURO|nr:alpha/beta-hydrolase [Aspergillus heteromorphus CBS 117.55]PWY90713.1 alpha/beta-hydrolase [Aspergillus heteromorphus CBS 117.55]
MPLNNYASDFSATLGGLTLDGFISSHGVVNLLNIPYAAIPARFQTASMLNPATTEGRLDARHYGPLCPQPADPTLRLFSHIYEQQSLSNPKDEVDCLHLNIYAPPSVFSQNAKKLPVLVWIHGGAFNTGSNATEYDGNHLVKRSIELGKPVIIVTINYRIHFLGFLSSQELIAEASDAGEVPILNQGLNDQKIALQWIQKNISHLGGDASQVTVAGESAGAASIFYLLKHGVPLFSKAIFCSCPKPMFRKLSETQQIFDSLVQGIGIDADAPYQVKLQALRAHNPEDLIALHPSPVVSYPIEDPNWFADWDPQQISSPDYWANLPVWCPEIIIGHLKDEAALFLSPAYPSDLTEEEAKTHVQTILSHPRPAEIALSAIRPSPDISPLHSLLSIATHALFTAPDLEFCTRNATKPHRKVYLYSIDIPDPYPGTDFEGNSPGPLGGYAWHSFGNGIFFYQPPARVDPEISATADRMSDAYTSFIYGDKGPAWEAFGEKGRMMSWNGSSTGLVDVGLGWKDLVREKLVAEGVQHWVDVYERDGWLTVIPQPALCRAVRTA